MNIRLTFYLCCCLLLFLNACSPVTKIKPQHSLNVSVWYAGKPLSCNGFDGQQDFWLIQQLAFFVSNVRLINAKQAYSVRLLPSDWQTVDLALIRPFVQDCDSAIRAQAPIPDEYNASVLFNSQISPSDADFLTFELSVPFALNHQNPLIQPSPLNQPSMFWSWQRGHKFLRMDLQSTQGSWAFHLGSVGCEAASSIRAPDLPCKQANRLAFNLPKMKEQQGKNQQGSQLILHLDRLLEGIPLKPSASCLFHGSAADSCNKLLSNMQSKHIFEWY